MTTPFWHKRKRFRIGLNTYFIEMILIFIPLNLESINGWTFHHGIVISIIISMITLAVNFIVYIHPKINKWLGKKLTTFCLSIIYLTGLLYSIYSIKGMILSLKGQAVTKKID